MTTQTLNRIETCEVITVAKPFITSGFWFFYFGKLVAFNCL